jgi:formamidopyrimidine-DNA glycosylase
MTASLGLDPLNEEEYTYDNFTALLVKKKCGIKAFLMDQTKLAGIGNVYVQDILFRSRLHPNRKINNLTEPERAKLFTVIRENLQLATERGGLQYERDLYGQSGRFNDFLVGYREGQVCPACGTTIVKIKTGSTATYICPQCQLSGAN